jgi:hypothetical protein
MSPIEIAETAKKGSPHHWQFSEAHIGSQYAEGFSYTVRS